MSKSIVVLKFGGTSVADEQGRKAAIRQIRAIKDSGRDAVAVVSAMGRLGKPYATDTLLSLTPEAGDRARDLLMSCGETIAACVMANELMQAGIPALPMNGASARVLTDGAFGRAEVTGMDIAPVLQALSQGQTPVITGFQGIGPGGELTTLGRGGSDTSAVEIGGYLGAERVLIFTDVPGVAVCDPRLVPEAPYLPAMDSRDILLLANYGAKVIHPRAVAAGQRHHIPVFVRSTFDDLPGTEITELPQPPAGLQGVAVLKSCIRSRVKALDALPVGDGFILPGGGDLSVVTALRRPLSDAQLFAASGLGELSRTGELLHLLVPDAEATETVRRLYEILK